MINELRTIAESVRSYGACGYERPELNAIPTVLHLIAAHLESEMRSWVHAELTIASSFTASPTAEAVIIDFPELRVVPSLVAQAGTSADSRLGEFHAAATRLADTAQNVSEAINTSTTVEYVSLIDEQVALILTAG